MTLYKGQVISFLGSKYMHHPTNYEPENNTDSGEKDWFKGSVLLVLATLSWASSSFRQVIKSFSSELVDTLGWGLMITFDFYMDN